MLSYSHLSATDAAGKKLAARMETNPEGNEIALVVNDAEAEYPVVVDPITTTLKQKLDAGESSRSSTPSRARARGRRRPAASASCRSPPLPRPRRSSSASPLVDDAGSRASAARSSRNSPRARTTARRALGCRHADRRESSSRRRIAADAAERTRRLGLHAPEGVFTRRFAQRGDRFLVALLAQRARGVDASAGRRRRPVSCACEHVGAALEVERLQDFAVDAHELAASPAAGSRRSARFSVISTLSDVQLAVLELEVEAQGQAEDLGDVARPSATA